MGSALEALSVSVSSGGAISVLVAGTISWLRQHYDHRHSGSTTTIKLRRADGASIEISAVAAGTWSPAELIAQMRHLAAFLDVSTPTAPARSARAPGPSRPER